MNAWKWWLTIGILGCSGGEGVAPELARDATVEDAAAAFEDATVDAGATSTDANVGEDVAPLVTPRRLVAADVPWPMIHQNGRGTKEGVGGGPSVGRVREEGGAGTPILLLVGDELVYQQTAGSSVIRAFARGDVTTEVASIDIGAPWPIGGGGNVDQDRRIWWNGRDADGNMAVVRVEGSLTAPVYSAPLTIPSGERGVSYNAITFLPDGALLVGTMSPYLFVVESEVGADGRFALRETFTKQEFRTADDRVVFSEAASYGPRPVEDPDGEHFYVNDSLVLAKLRYDAASGTFDRTVAWVFEGPEGARANLAVSNPIVVGDSVCVATEPLVAEDSQRVHCVDRETGTLRFSVTPFPRAGISAAHTLGAIESRGWVFSIARSEDGGGGVAGFSLATGEPLWPYVELDQVSESFVIAPDDLRLYVASMEAGTRRFEIRAVDLTNGSSRAIYAATSVRSPSPALGALGGDNLYFPTPNGFVRIED
ncbi:MAG: PQQ-binding-like beta-propeller repeat protein [Polyangiales bacterium]